MNGRTPYQWTLADLRRDCPLLAKIEVIGHGPSVAGCQTVKGTEELIGRNHLGEIVVRVKGKVTPANVKKFRDTYGNAKAAGILKPRQPKELS
jgi:hypothetical protein